MVIATLKKNLDFIKYGQNTYRFSTNSRFAKIYQKILHFFKTTSSIRLYSFVITRLNKIGTKYALTSVRELPLIVVSVRTILLFLLHREVHLLFDFSIFRKT